MKIFIKAKPGARAEKVVKVSDIHFEVSVKERPEGGKANAAIIRALADSFGIAPSRINIISGHAAKTKIIEVL